MDTPDVIGPSLKPGYSYVVFEKATAWEQSNELHTVIQILQDIWVSYQIMKLVRGSAGSNSLMLVQLEPCPTATIMQRLLSAGLPEGVSLYAYGSVHAEQVTHNGMDR